MWDEEERHTVALRKWKEEFARIKLKSELYINKLLQNNIHGVVRRIFCDKQRTIPRLKVISTEGVVERIASTDTEKAELLSDVFARNSSLPLDFEVKKEHVFKVGAQVNSILEHHVCVEEIIRRVAPERSPTNGEGHPN